MRDLLARRDLGAVYRYLNHRGVSQRRIAALTGQSQSEISEIIAGRKVVSVELLEKIADGLGIPRGWLGVAHADRDMAPLFIAPPEVFADLVEDPGAVAVPDTPELRLAVRAFIAGLGLRDALEAVRQRSAPD